MNTIQKRRFISVIILVLGLGVVATLVLLALRQNIQFYYTPSQLIEQNKHSKQYQENVVSNHSARVRLGGMVLKGSVKYREKPSEEQSNLVQFTVTDFTHQIVVLYSGILPDLFKEGQGVVVTGHLGSEYFKADEVLAKHDENYMPPQVASHQ